MIACWLLDGTEPDVMYDQCKFCVSSVLSIVKHHFQINET